MDEDDNEDLIALSQKVAAAMDDAEAIYKSPLRDESLDLKHCMARAAAIAVVKECVKVAENARRHWKPGDEKNDGTIIARAIAYRIGNLAGQY